MTQAAQQKAAEGPALPGGTVTLLLTDIEGSTSLWEQAPAEMATAVRRHHEILHEAIENFGGHRPADQGEGDSIFAGFPTASSAMSAILEAQIAIVKEPWPTPRPLRVRAALHTGEVELRDGRNYFGSTVNKTARLRALAHGGQVLVSQVTRDLTKEPPQGSHYIELGLHRLKDLSHPEHVYQLSHPALASEFPTIKSVDAVPNNLPVQLTSLVGREDEATHVQQMLHRSRLITLTGAAGCGKTRLSLHIAAENLDDYPDGIWFVDLAPISDPDLVAQAVADALGLQSSVLDSEASSRNQEITELSTRVIHFIGSKTTLMILDNCEHLIDASARLAGELLRSCVNLKIVATTREPLGVPGEATYRVPSLSSPDPDHLPPIDEVLGFDAVHLFVERAVLSTGDFTLTPQNAGAVVQICRRLDGIPLAIELAAALVSALTPQQIADRLDDQFRLLTGGSRTSLERQQTLRAAVDWSYKLLSEQERTLLRRLAIFHGGFTLESAEKVASGGGIEEGDVIGLVAQLVSKSLVQRETGGGDGRYRLLETIRQFSREKLLETDEVEDSLRKHRDFFLEFAEKAQQEMDGPNVGLGMENLAAEFDNLRAALAWSAGEDDQKVVFRFGWALSRFWVARGYAREGYEVLKEALMKDTEPSPERMKWLAATTHIVIIGKSASEARGLADQLMHHAELFDDDWGRARAYLASGLLGSTESQVARGHKELEQAEKLAEKVGDSFTFTFAPLYRSLLAAGEGDDSGQARFLETALNRARASNQKLLLGRILGSMVEKAMETADWKAFNEFAKEGLSVAQDAGDKMSVWMYSAALSPEVGAHDPQWANAVAAVKEAGNPSLLYTLGRVAMGREAYAEAKAIWDDVIQVAREQKLPGLPRLLNQVAWATLIAGDLEEARKYLEECIPLARKGDVKILIGPALHSYGEVLRVAGDLEAARQVLDEAESRSRDSGQNYAVSDAVMSLGDVDREEGSREQAAARYLEAGLMRTAMGIAVGIPPVLERLAGLALDLRLIEQGVRLAASADASRKSQRSHIEPVYLKAYERDLEGLREAAGDQWSKWWEEGASSSGSEALDLGTQMLEPDRVTQIKEAVERLLGSNEEAG
ncbi:MAG TPA: adenylate/guanylate cyclase domain-containing protein [Actinomycetota bacterium]|nr:adenylate/guanylate cyclase domain-containing protein [Actinomycetota bacterium]